MSQVASSVLRMRLRPVFWAIVLFAIGVSSPSYGQDAGGMSFKVTADRAEAMGEVLAQGYRNIYASGRIHEGDAARFVAFVKARDLDAAKVVLDSPGGSLLEGVKLGRAIRALGFSTSIGTEQGSAAAQGQAICASACAYAFAGGVLRYISSDSDQLGLHQFSSSSGPGVSEGDAQLVSGLLVAYLTEMGVDATAFAVASVTDPSAIIWLTPDQAEALGFANNGVSPTTADVKIVDMHPYLRLNQNKPGIGLRVLLLCWNSELSLDAGLVTDAEQSADWHDAEWLKRSYLELDGVEVFAMPSITGTNVRESTVWLSRKVDRAAASALLKTDDLGIWLDGFGMLRAGGVMDLRSVRPVLRDYISQCLAS